MKLMKKFNGKAICPICGSKTYNKVSLPFRGHTSLGDDGPAPKGDSFCYQCSKCSVMFFDPEKFPKLKT
jgi:uncharacterized OB-fold protein